MEESSFRLTYGSMFDPPESLHVRFEEALARVRAAQGQFHALEIDGKPVRTTRELESRSPIDRRELLARVALGGPDELREAVDAAARAFPAWAATPWAQRVSLLRGVARRIEARVYELAAALALEVGKNRMEALGEIQETADLIAWYCDEMERNDGFLRELPDEPLHGYRSRNRTWLRPCGVWAVIAPFNFPSALAGGPIGAALVAGNTVVFKVASQTPWAGALLMQVFREAGLPDGVLNHVTCSGADAMAVLSTHPQVAGLTFTGSSESGRELIRAFAAGDRPRPVIAEMGGKNAVIVSRHADLERAATGIVRSAFGLTGQKCSACSRVYVEAPVAQALRERLVTLTEAVRVGDPVLREHWMGPLIGTEAVERFERCVAQLRRHGNLLTGGEVLREGALQHGHFVQPTVATAPRDFRLWREEKFIPLVLVETVDSVEEGIALANALPYGLTAGFYGAPQEIQGVLDRLEAGVVYVNRPHGATTGAWPGYQPFGGWKGSGNTGKSIGSFWYLPQYLREQSQTIVD